MAAQQLIPIFTGEITEQETQFCNARDLHRSLKVGRDFTTWIKGRIDEYGFVRRVDFEVFDSPVSGNQKSRRGGDRRSIDYRLTLDMAKELAMIENNEIGRAVRRYFIQCETALRAELREKASHVLPVRGVKLMRDGLSFKDTMRLQEQSRKVLRMIMTAPTKAERQNLFLHFRQINLTLGVPTLELDEIEAEITLLNERAAVQGENHG